MPGELGDEHEVRALADHPSQEGVAQHVRGELQAGILAKSSDDVVNRPLRQPPAAAADEQRSLALARERAALLEPFLEDLPHQALSGTSRYASPLPERTTTSPLRAETRTSSKSSATSSPSRRPV